jgi:anti-sigma regulatory factor (Ser/Thr protein kinase)
MFEFLKLIISKEFISNSRDIISLIRKSKEWKKDIVIYSGKFSKSEEDESTVLIDKSISVLKDKGWSKEESTEVEFIAKEIVRNAFKYGIKNPETGMVFCKMTLTSSFAKILVEDNGVNFELLEELKMQDAFGFNKDKHKGLSFVCRITQEIKQEKSGINNRIIVIKRNGVRPLRIKKIEGISVFSIGEALEEDSKSYDKLLELLKLLLPNEKIIINFGSEARSMGSRVAVSLKEIFVPIQKEGRHNIAICGLENSTFAVYEYFEHYFPVFANLDEAIDFLHQVD